MTDALIVVGEQSFPIHTFVLAARSSVFQVMFAADMSESRCGVVEIDDVEPDVFRQFLRFVYTGQLDGPLSSALASVAHKYGVKTLEDLCGADARLEEFRPCFSEEDDAISSVFSVCPLDPMKNARR